MGMIRLFIDEGFIFQSFNNYNWSTTFFIFLLDAFLCVDHGWGTLSNFFKALY